MKLNQWIHFSIDDVIEVFDEINREKPESIFKKRFFKHLLDLHQRFEINVTLYVFEKNKSFCLEQLSDKYWEELKKCKWIKFGWHRKEDGSSFPSAEEEVNSFEKITQLLIEKLGKEQIDDIICLHRYKVSEPLLNALVKYGVKTVLTTEIKEYMQEGISLEAAKRLINTRECYSHDLCWRKRDISFDDVNSDEKVEETVKYTQEILINYIKKNIEIFCHEQKLEDIIEYLERYFEALENKRVDELLRASIFPSVGTVVGDVLYFTADFDSNIYSLDLNSKKVEKFVALREDAYFSNLSFVAMHNYNNYLILIPNKEDAIWKIDIISKKYKIIPLVNKLYLNEGSWKFRKSVQKGNRIWFIQNLCPVLYEFNIDTEEYEIYLNWPKEIVFKEGKRCFMSIVLNNDYLYMFADEASSGVRFHIEEHQMEVWDEGVGKFYGQFHEDKLYCAPVKWYQNSMICGSVEKDNPFELKGCGEKRNEYYFWNPVKYQNTIYFAPYYEDKILLYDFEKECLKKIEITSEKYKTWFDVKAGFGIYEILFYGKIAVLMPFYNDTIVFIDIETGEFTEKQIARPFKEEVKENFLRRYLNGGILSEGDGFLLQDVLESNISVDRMDRREGRVEGVGKIIYQEMRE